MQKEKVDIGKMEMRPLCRFVFRDIIHSVTLNSAAQKSASSMAEANGTSLCKKYPCLESFVVCFVCLYIPHGLREKKHDSDY